MYFAVLALAICAGCEKTPKEKVVPAPELTKITPTSGYAGDVATITGANFSTTASENEVKVGGVAAEVTTATETSLAITLPENPEGAATVTVSVNGKTAEKTLTFTYLKVFKPMSVRSISPAEATVGSEVVIAGDNFGTDASALRVVFGEAQAEIKAVTETSITVVVPEGKGEVAVVVAKGDEVSDAVLFTYHFDREIVVTGLTPAIATAGDEISIVGTGFSANVDDYKVSVDGIAATVTVAGEEGIKVEIPTGLKRGEDYTFVLNVTGAAPVESVPFRYYAVDKYKVEQVIGNFTSGTSTIIEGVGLEANIPIPEGVCINPDGTELWVTSRGGSGASGQHGIHKVNLSTMQVTTVAKQDVIGTNKYPWGGDFNSKGEYHVCLKGIGAYGKVVNGEYSEYSILKEDNTTKAAAVPMNLIFDASDNMYISNRDAKEVVVAYNGAYVKSFTGCPIKIYTIAFNPEKNVIACGGNGGYKIVLLDVATGVYTEVAGAGTKPTTDNYTDGVPGDPSTAMIGSISGIYWDNDGCIYFNDQAAFTFRVLIPGVGGDYTKGVVKTLAGTPCTQGLADGDGLTEVKFKAQGMVTKDPKTGAFYMAENNNHRIRRISVSE